MKKMTSAFLAIIIALSLSACGKPNNADVGNETNLPLYKVQIEIICISNLLFSTYDIDIYVDGEKLGTLEHGATGTYEVELEKGTYEVKVTKEGDTSVDGTATFDVSESIKITYKINCHSDQVNIEQEYIESMSPLAEGQVKVPKSAADYRSETFETVSAELKTAGFTNIGTKVIRDLTGDWLDVDGDIEGISIGGNTEFQRSEVYSCDVEIIITYHTLELTTEEMLAIITDHNGDAASDILASFDGCGYTVICSVAGKEITEFDPDGYIFTDGWLEPEEKIIHLNFISEEMIAVQANLEDSFPQEYAKRAAVVALTNSQATDVFMSDGNTYDTSKFHSYSDLSGFYITITDEGDWSAKDEHTWHVNGLIGMLSGYSTYIKATLDVVFDGTNYVVSNVDSIIAAKEYLDSDDPSKISPEHFEPSESNPFLIVSPSLIQDDRDKAAERDQNNRTSATEERTAWIESQFSLWDGAHKDLENLIKKNLNDEKSYKHIETTYIDVTDESKQTVVNETLKNSGYSQRVEIGDLLIMTEFSAKNAFNATIKYTAIGIASYNNNTITLVGIE